jgi:ppGpp synthetase/RelA/SpoT-type nucleotidyltranferase
MASELFRTIEEEIEMEDIFDEYRKAHLEPLTHCTLELQSWLSEYQGRYYIAQRLKRKPQILRKLKRLSVRLSQLQDIGGCRIIVEDNREVDALLHYIESKVEKGGAGFTISRVTDYRQLGRDDTGYRALHIILDHAGYRIELQLRSRIQHFWSESIERTSVVYGYYIKEKEGDPSVIDYFKALSNAFHEIESGRQLSAFDRLRLNSMREAAESKIRESDRNKVLGSYVNTDIIRTLSQIETSKGYAFNNWIIIFDWNSGAFVSWDIVEREADSAIKAYVAKERQFPAKDGFEVVLIGSSDVATVKDTHSHYFGVEETVDSLRELEGIATGLANRLDIDSEARRILMTLHRRNYWGKKTVSLATLKNHYCKHVLSFESSLATLKEKNLIIMPSKSGPVSLRIDASEAIKKYL